MIARLATPDPVTHNPLWEAAGDDTWTIHDWLHYQPSAQEYEDRRDAGKRAARARWHADRNAEPNADRIAERIAPGTAEPTADGNTTSVRTPSPIPPTPETVRPPTTPTDGSDAHPLSHQQIVDEATAITTLLEIPDQGHNLMAVCYTIASHPQVDALNVAIDYSLYRDRTPKERRRSPAEGFQIAMSSAGKRAMFQRTQPQEPPPAPEDLDLPAATTEWAAIRAELILRVGAPTYLHWFAGVTDRIVGNALQLSLASEFQAEWVATRLPQVVNDAARAAGITAPIQFLPPQQGDAS